MQDDDLELTSRMFHCEHCEHCGLILDRDPQRCRQFGKAGREFLGQAKRL